MDLGSAPAQLLYGRSRLPRVPTTETALDKADRSINDRRDSLKEKVAARYNTGARDLPVLKQGQAVRVQNTTTKLWDSVGIVVRAEAKERTDLVTHNKHVFNWPNRQ